MNKTAVQDTYPEDYSHCFGCGCLNAHGHQIKSYWDGETSVCRFRPEPHHTALPGFAYGGLIASLIDCHATGTACAAAYQEQGRPLGSMPPLRFVTASLHVDFKRPTPIDADLELTARVKEIKGRKVVVAVDLSAGNQVCARGEVVAVQMPASMMADDG